MVTVMSWDTATMEWLCFPETGLLAGRGEWGAETLCLLIIFVYLASLLTLYESTLSGYVVFKV